MKKEKGKRKNATARQGAARPMNARDDAAGALPMVASISNAGTALRPNRGISYDYR